MKKLLLISVSSLMLALATTPSVAAQPGGTGAQPSTLKKPVKKTLAKKLPAKKAVAKRPGAKKALARKKPRNARTV